MYLYPTRNFVNYFSFDFWVLYSIINHSYIIISFIYVEYWIREASTLGSINPPIWCFFIEQQIWPTLWRSRRIPRRTKRIQHCYLVSYKSGIWSYQWYPIRSGITMEDSTIQNIIWFSPSGASESRYHIVDNDQNKRALRGPFVLERILPLTPYRFTRYIE